MQERDHLMWTWKKNEWHNVEDLNESEDIHEVHEINNVEDVNKVEDLCEVENLNTVEDKWGEITEVKDKEGGDK